VPTQSSKALRTIVKADGHNLRYSIPLSKMQLTVYGVLLVGLKFDDASTIDWQTKRPIYN
jgi:hypothetical protein